MIFFFFECPGCSHYLDLIFGCVISHTQFWVFESYQKGKVILPTQPSSPSSWGGFTKSLWWPSWPLSLMLKAELQQVKTEPAEETEARTIQPTAQEPIQPTAQEQLHHIWLCCCFSCSVVSDSLRPIDCILEARTIQPTAQEQLHHIRLCCCFSCSAVSDSLRPIDCSPPASSVNGVSQARILEWIAISFSRGSSWPRD